jgi:protein lysine acetyltransferase
MKSDPEQHLLLNSLLDTPGAARLATVVFEQGDLLLREGDSGDFFLIIVEGDADVYRDHKLVATVHAGSVVGELSLLTGTARTSSVVARTPIHARRGSADDFVELLESDPVREHFANLAASRLAANLAAVSFTTPAGFDGELRPLLPSDRPAYMDLLSKLSPESRRLRFFTASLPSEKLINYLLGVDFIHHFAWVVLDRSTAPHEGCAVARLIRNDADPARAEAAFAVIDAMQGKGIGTISFGAIGVAASALGVETVTAQILDENTAMRRVFEKAAPKWTRPDRGILEAEMSTEAICALLNDDVRLALAGAVRGIGLAAEIGLRIHD